jgi:hypothetical protein
MSGARRVLAALFDVDTATATKKEMSDKQREVLSSILYSATRRR